jgi:hypothetical protein
MRVIVPISDFPLVRITLVTPTGDEVHTVVDDSHRVVDLVMPEGVSEDEVDVYSCFLGSDQKVPYGCGAALLHAATRKPEPAPAPAAEPAGDAPVETATAAGCDSPAVEPSPTDTSAPVPEPTKPVEDHVQETMERYGLPRTQPSVMVD